MKKLTVTFLILLPLVALIVACPGPDNNPGGTAACKPDSVAAFPNGFDYPVSQQRIAQWVKNNQIDSIRIHAWNLWAGINQLAPNNSKRLVWQTWYSVSQAFDHTTSQNKIGSPLAHLSQRQIELKMLTGGDTSLCSIVPIYDKVHNPNTTDMNGVPDHGFLANNGDIMIAGVYYNWEAYNHIRTDSLYLKSKLQSYLKNPTQAPGGNIPDFPAGAITLKNMYWPVKQDGYSALPLWNYNAVCSDVNYNGFENWTDGVAIDPSNGTSQIATVSVSYLHGVGKGSLATDLYPTQTFTNAKVVPINQFYSWKIDAVTWNNMTKTDQDIINNSFQWAYGRNFKPGDYLVCLAMHIITKEYYDWTMQSFWWHGAPSGSPYSANQPTNLPTGQWRYYESTTSYSMVTPTEPDGSPNISFNPYIELVVGEQHRIESNCQNCHSRASSPEAAQNFFLDPIGAGPFPWSPGAHYNSTQRGQINPTDSIFLGQVRTDFSWAIPDRAQ